MNCDEAEILVAAYVDREIDHLREHAIEKHLRGCTACAAKHQAALALGAQIRAELPYFAAPPALRERVLAQMTDARDLAPARRRLERDRSRWRWLVAGSVAGSAATMLAWVAGTAVIDRRANEGVAAEAVAAHVRATLNQHLIEVASSDQHTVKPWLSARLDYSPPVENLASEGFTLEGGRLDTLDHQRVATLVYRYRLHTIDVYVRPEPAHAPSSLSTLRGFNVAHAVGTGMDWLAVSDVSADVLAAFVQRLAHADATR